ncbi:hypothetical protein HYH02_014590 [Chlamydomonas schloesseri]|uniref:Uncharacterized protein n=1 Tax=Chlamydomonas schloesseri TaxID=2026947 RepID=A0A835SSC0_9CHLO|nr:hypothetical protein HYH02_014590 [Chlamydomonas schloesseri]|eukprot:KAG2427369.1 hypothetical protein HYH02_014590 [Chlamydomonas schloesseri]
MEDVGLVLDMDAIMLAPAGQGNQGLGQQAHRQQQQQKPSGGGAAPTEARPLNSVDLLGTQALEALAAADIDGAAHSAGGGDGADWMGGPRQHGGGNNSRKQGGQHTRARKGSGQQPLLVPPAAQPCGRVEQAGSEDEAGLSLQGQASTVGTKAVSQRAGSVGHKRAHPQPPGASGSRSKRGGGGGPSKVHALTEASPGCTEIMVKMTAALGA